VTLERNLVQRPTWEELRGVLYLCVIVWALCYSLPLLVMVKVLGRRSNLNVWYYSVLTMVLLAPSVPAAIALSWIRTSKAVSIALGALVGFAGAIVVFVFLVCGLSSSVIQSSLGSLRIDQIRVIEFIGASAVYIVITAWWSLPLSPVAGGLSGFMIWRRIIRNEEAQGEVGR
jgi:ABC-type methionine transport system permease subunit